MTDERIGSIVVAFKPDENIYDLILSASKQFDEVVVYNNFMEDEQIKTIVNMNLLNVGIIGTGENFGIAIALNKGMEELDRLDCQYVFSFDQDSKIPKDFSERMIKSYKILSENGDKIGFVAPIFLDGNTGEKSGLLKLGKLWYKRKTAGFNRFEEVTTVITSGSLIRMSDFKNMGTYIDSMFIDYVDNEYCYRLVTAGYKIFVDTSIVMDHTLGARTVHKVGPLRIKPTHHNVIRKYYISRNRIFCIRKYGMKIGGLIPFEVIVTTMDIIRVSVFEKDKKMKLKAIARGFKDGIRFNP
ncbi:glycosyltransferase family 2 protein [Deinococcus sp. A31D244]|uniref:glycosyltransferase family 2 protein n=1 Tax=Deinococcus sp. A31D244 TaxID=3397675 RepID=UPI0039E15587